MRAPPPRHVTYVQVAQSQEELEPCSAFLPTHLRRAGQKKKQQEEANAMWEIWKEREAGATCRHVACFRSIEASCACTEVADEDEDECFEGGMMQMQVSVSQVVRRFERCPQPTPTPTTLQIFDPPREHRASTDPRPHGVVCSECESASFGQQQTKVSKVNRYRQIATTSRRQQRHSTASPAHLRIPCAAGLA